MEVLATRLLNVDDFNSVMPVVKVVEAAEAEFPRLVDALGGAIVRLSAYTGSLDDTHIRGIYAALSLAHRSIFVRISSF